MDAWRVRKVISNPKNGVKLPSMAVRERHCDAGNNGAPATQQSLSTKMVWEGEFRQGRDAG